MSDMQLTLIDKVSRDLTELTLDLFEKIESTMRDHIDSKSVMLDIIMTTNLRCLSALTRDPDVVDKIMDKAKKDFRDFMEMRSEDGK